MPAGEALINAVASVLTDEPSTTGTIRNRLAGHYSLRAVRYALAALIVQGRARRKLRAGLYVAHKPEIQE